LIVNEITSSNFYRYHNNAKENIYIKVVIQSRRISDFF